MKSVFVAPLEWLTLPMILCGLVRTDGVPMLVGPIYIKARPYVVNGTRGMEFRCSECDEFLFLFLLLGWKRVVFVVIMGEVAILYFDYSSC